MAVETFRFIESKKYANKHLVQGLRHFSVNVAKIHFGDFFSSPENFTVSWPGAVDFVNIERTALECLSLSVSNGHSVEPEHLLDNVSLSASLILPDKMLDLDLLDLTQHPQREEYLRHLKNHGSILFARYNLADVSSPESATHSFTADNPKTDPPGWPELTIQLPRSRPLSPGLLDWMINHHVHKVNLRLHLPSPTDIGDFARAFPV